MTAVLTSLTLIAAGDPAQDAANVAPPDLEWRSDRRCGPNCLYVVLFMCGKRPDYDALVSKFTLTDRGANVADMVRVAGEFGLPMAALRAEASALGDLPLPAIVHCRDAARQGGHYLLLLSINKDETFTIIGCTTGKMLRLSKGDFYDLWTGVILVRSNRRDAKWLDRLLLVSSVVLLVAISACVFRWSRARAAREAVGCRHNTR